ncbi:uncharacterized protein CIMG_12668 [Coccidioides immitis RS]|uniref:Uncharacterized protein n=1 Tax=Coccidioides immitis (strain RS) TaxID=246410 RepID=A0A0D8JS82_COCIM|nr:uncharacterized protein CIMG_12668 [Coccidioides immitis RS]KJF59999.1 hypothetical protein CIMG_12668 [Coccidioides immitis RS]
MAQSQQPRCCCIVISHDLNVGPASLQQAATAATKIAACVGVLIGSLEWAWSSKR